MFAYMLIYFEPFCIVLNTRMKYVYLKVAGDCTYFDCKRLPLILEKEVLSSIPVGLPVSNCDVVLVGDDAPYEGEIYVGGLCVAAGYFHYPYVMPLADGDWSPEHDIRCPNSGCRVQHYFKTGDFARKLPSGDLVFLGRKDRTIKVNGQRIALEEIESAFRDHPDVVDAAVLSREVDGEFLLLEAHVVTEKAAKDDELLKFSLRNWILSTQMMIPTHIFFTRSLPLTSSGKVDYFSLAASTPSDQQARINIQEIPQDYLIQVIRKVLLANHRNFKHPHCEHTCTHLFFLPRACVTHIFSLSIDCYASLLKNGGRTTQYQLVSYVPVIFTYKECVFFSGL